MTTGTYGLSQQAPMTRSMGGGLNSLANSEEQTASAMAGKAAEAETRRNIAGDQMERARKAGNASLGASAGALIGMQYGATLGPWGAAAGALIGGIAGGAF